MPFVCGACCSTIGNFYLECSNGKCHKKYHLTCLDINIDTFESFSPAYKKAWICPECVCSNPKGGNLETPIKANTDFENVTTPSNNINLQRGSQSNVSPIMMDDDYVVLKELKKFRSEMIARMDSQANAISLLLNQFSQTKQDLGNIIKIVGVLEQKVDAKINQTGQMVHVADDKPSITTFAEAVGKQRSSGMVNKVSTNSQQGQHNIKTVEKVQKVNKGGATKSAVLPTTSTDTTSPLKTDVPCHDIVEDNQCDWTIVRNRRVNQRLKEVRVGTNVELKAIKAMERNKHLHVWRLHPDTTLEAVTDHVRNICGPEVYVKVNKINHKTERDYSSFIVGVPEKWYDKLNVADVWPINTEFNEWIWFRRSTQKTPNS